MTPVPTFTPTEQRILDVLNDGLRHTVDELRHCLTDELSVSAVKVHVCHIRAKLKEVGRDVVAEHQLFPRSVWTYRQVRLLHFDPKE